MIREGSESALSRVFSAFRSDFLYNLWGHTFSEEIKRDLFTTRK